MAARAKVARRASILGLRSRHQSSRRHSAAHDQILSSISGAGGAEDCAGREAPLPSAQTAAKQPLRIAW